MQRLARWAGPIIAGCIAGYVSSIGWRWLEAGNQTAPHQQIQIRVTPTAPIAASDGGIVVPHFPPETTAISDPAPLDPADPAETQPDGRDDFRVLLASHDAEPVDYPWAHAMQAVIEPRAQEIAATAGATVQGVDCRQDSCGVVLRWPSYGAAHIAAGLVAGGDYAVACPRGLSLLGEPDAVGPIDVTLLLFCADAPNRGLP